MTLRTQPNPDLCVGPDRLTRWNSAPNRRESFHNLHRTARYVQSFRAGRVLDLRLSSDLTIPLREDVRRLTTLPWFSAMAVTEGNRLLFESHAADFPPDRPHSIMSISKMSVNLLIGRLWDEGRIDLQATLGTILPGIGPGYHGATVQDALDMNLQNDFDEDYSNPMSAAFRHEVALGMRLSAGEEPTNRAFLESIGLAPGQRGTRNLTGTCLYKIANTDVLALAAEACMGRPLHHWLADLADAAGVEGAVHVGTDREGFPTLNGGLCLTARDLCRYGALFARKGMAATGQPFGSAAFLDLTLAGGVPMPAPRAHLRYSNQTNTNGTWIGHGGYGGQYLVANPETGRVACFLSVLQNDAGYDADYYPPIIAMLADICAG
jgi:CubicO group peptidase (beta-lactamase class C family)